MGRRHRRAVVTAALRLATHNVWGVRGDWEQRLQILRRGYEQLAADVVTLQETILDDEVDQARSILGDGYKLVQQRSREPDGQGVTIASRWPVGEVVECDLDVTPRTGEFACTTLIAEVLAPEPLGRMWIANHLPDYQLDHEHERCLQAVVAAQTLEELAGARPGHVIVAGDFDADPESASVRFWTGRQPLEGLSVCFRDAWESTHAGETGGTFVPENPYSADWDWPYRRIDYVLVRCGTHGGPTLSIEDCRRTFDGFDTTASDHYGVVADLSVPGFTVQQW
jgi:endonuclease/exonuclease/phosphatase family metal-dependent hydrolase